jgi:hypothetical protein
MNTTLFTLFITLMSPAPTDGLKYETTRTVVANLTEQQCVAQRDAAYADAIKEKKNVIASCKQQ